jgi:hypothetical protein
MDFDKELTTANVSVFLKEFIFYKVGKTYFNSKNGYSRHHMWTIRLRKKLNKRLAIVERINDKVLAKYANELFNVSIKEMNMVGQIAYSEYVTALTLKDAWIDHCWHDMCNKAE